MTIRRLKTYASAQGFVYQYCFVGQRTVESRIGEGAVGGAAEYIFDVTSDRRTMVPLRVVLPERIVAGWARDHGRKLTGPERYAAVKMSLFRAFDEIESLLCPGCQLIVTGEILEAVLRQLGVD